MESRNKRDIVFLVIAIAIFIGSIFFVRSRSTTASAPATPVPAGTRAAAQPTAPSAPVKPVVVARRPPLPPTGRNPFALPPGAPKVAPPKATPVMPAAAAAPVAVAVAPAPVPAPVAMPAAMPPLGAQMMPAGTAAAPSAPAGPTLSGIVGGSSRTLTAIIRVGSKRYYVKQGDAMAGGYTVQSIGGQKVVLVGTQGKLILKMGGS
jgi:hypothetical protein